MEDFFTEATFNVRRQDFIARQVLADISGLTVNDTRKERTIKMTNYNERFKEKEKEFDDKNQEFRRYFGKHVKIVTFEDGFYRGFMFNTINALPGDYVVCRELKMTNSVTLKKITSISANSDVITDSISIDYIVLDVVDVKTIDSFIDSTFTKHLELNEKYVEALNRYNNAKFNEADVPEEVLATYEELAVKARETFMNDIYEAPKTETKTTNKKK